jgi:hypothetical protein
MFGKPLIQWSDEDLAVAARIYKDCEAQLHNKMISFCMQGGSRDRQYCEQGNPASLGLTAARLFEANVRDTVMLARNMDAQRKAQEAARIKAQQDQLQYQAQRDKEAAEEAARQEAERVQLQKEQLQYQAQRDKEAAEAATRSTELEKSQLEDVTKQAEEARRARQEAEQKLKQLREATAAQQTQQQRDLAQTQQSERQTDLLRRGYDTISVQNFELDGADLAGRTAKLAVSGAYVREGNLDVLYTDTQAAGMAYGGVRRPKVPLLIDNAPRELRERLQNCRTDLSTTRIGCAVTVLGHATRCTVTNAFGTTREEPCLEVESGG